MNPNDEAIEGTATEAPNEDFNAVIVTKHKDEQGNISTDVILQGVEATEAQTLLELGLITWRSKIGLPR